MLVFTRMKKHKTALGHGGQETVVLGSELLLRFSNNIIAESLCTLLAKKKF